MTDVRIQEARGLRVAEADTEIVERKGLGHPDTVCDAVMERVPVELGRAYLARFGRIAHYTCDKRCLLAGQVELRLGGGRVLEPMRLILGDRAASEMGGARVDVASVATEAAKAWFRENLRRIGGPGRPGDFPNPPRRRVLSMQIFNILNKWTADRRPTPRTPPSGPGCRRPRAGRRSAWSGRGGASSGGWSPTSGGTASPSPGSRSS